MVHLERDMLPDQRQHGPRDFFLRLIVSELLFYLNLCEGLNHIAHLDVVEVDE